MIFMHDPGASGAAGSRIHIIARSDLSAVAQRAKAESDEAIQLSFSLRQSWIASLALAMTF
jgi:phage gp46-like protein